MRGRCGLKRALIGARRLRAAPPHPALDATRGGRRCSLETARFVNASTRHVRAGFGARQRALDGGAREQPRLALSCLQCAAAAAGAAAGRAADGARWSGVRRGAAVRRGGAAQSTAVGAHRPPSRARLSPRGPLRCRNADSEGQPPPAGRDAAGADARAVRAANAAPRTYRTVRRGLAAATAPAHTSVTLPITSAARHTPTHTADRIAAAAAPYRASPGPGRDI